MIKTILIDDEPLARSIVVEYLQNYPEIKILQECNDGFEGVKAIAQHKPDLIFLDIHLPKLKGMAFLKTLTNPPSIIITTAYHQYAVEGFNHREIGEKLNISEGTSKWHLSEARKSLQKQLEHLKY